MTTQQELMNRLGAKTCSRCADLEAQLATKDYWFHVFFTKKDNLRPIWAIAFFTLLGLIVVPSMIWITNEAVTSTEVSERRECREACAFMGGRRANYYDGHCFCQTRDGIIRLK